MRKIALLFMLIIYTDAWAKLTSYCPPTAYCTPEGCSPRKNDPNFYMKASDMHNMYRPIGEYILTVSYSNPSDPHYTCDYTHNEKNNSYHAALYSYRLMEADDSIQGNKWVNKQYCIQVHGYDCPFKWESN